ncbi:MAG: hypothetical protein GY804_07265 [Alphaproteobacteria bacterium]|nr:hypothetical protein [Alphaproteobacteria bacterium]
MRPVNKKIPNKKVKSAEKHMPKEDGQKHSSGVNNTADMLEYAAPDIIGDTLHVDVMTLPVKYVDRSPRAVIVVKIISGLFMAFFGSLLMFLSSAMVKSASFEGLFDEGIKASEKEGSGLLTVFFAMLLIVVGIVVVAYYFLEFFKCKIIRINRKFVNVAERNIRGSVKMFLEPLCNYTGVKIRTRAEEHNGCLFKQRIIEITHKDDEEKNIPLFVGNDAYADDDLGKKMAKSLGLSIVK